MITEHPTMFAILMLEMFPAVGDHRMRIESIAARPGDQERAKCQVPPLRSTSSSKDPSSAELPKEIVSNPQVTYTVKPQASISNS